MVSFFSYDRIDESIPDSCFTYTDPKPAKIEAAPPLGDKYTTRFIHIIDANGGCSIRFGMFGPKATYSSGLN